MYKKLDRLKISLKEFDKWMKKHKNDNAQIFEHEPIRIKSYGLHTQKELKGVIVTDDPNAKDEFYLNTNKTGFKW